MQLFIYKKLLKKELQENPEVAQSFYRDLPKVSEKVMVELNTKISAEELYSALQSLEIGKALAMDFPLTYTKLSGLFWGRSTACSQGQS